jgi:hypothetical protein
MIRQLSDEDGIIQNTAPLDFVRINRDLES